MTMGCSPSGLLRGLFFLSSSLLLLPVLSSDNNKQMTEVQIKIQSIYCYITYIDADGEEREMKVRAKDIPDARIKMDEAQEKIIREAQASVTE